MDYSLVQKGRNKREIRGQDSGFRSWSLLLLVLTLLPACGYYSFKGALPSHIQTIAIPLFDDRTAYPGVRENLTNSVIDAFISDNTLTVVDETQADVLLTGTITSINQSAATVTSGETVTEYKVTVTVKAKAEDLKTSKMLFDRSFSEYGLMPSQGGQEEFDVAVEEAIERIREDILNATLASW
jgi:outer membrane lipopolysaccharide assembly protein LptE/RlpB